MRAKKCNANAVHFKQEKNSIDVHLVFERCRMRGIVIRPLGGLLQGSPAVFQERGSLKKPDLPGVLM